MLLSEPKRVKIGKARDLEPGASKTIHIGDLSITIYNVDGEHYAIEDRCPHRGASLANGVREDLTVSCPLHHWHFNLKTGECRESAGTRLRRFDVLRDGESLLVDVSSGEEEEQQQPWNGDYRYLLRYGVMGWVGHFSSVEPIDCQRGAQLVVQTHRGSEVAEVLLGPQKAVQPLTPTESADDAPPSLAGEVLRKCSTQDLQQWEQCRQSETATVFARCQQLLTDAELPIEVVDIERLFDERTTVLYFLGEDNNWLHPIAETLEEDWDGEIVFNPVHEPTSAPGGCGSGGCGSGGCGTGGGEESDAGCAS